MSEGYHFSDCPSRSGAPDCDCRYRGEEIEKKLDETLLILKFISDNRERFVEFDPDGVKSAVVALATKALSPSTFINE